MNRFLWASRLGLGVAVLLSVAATAFLLGQRSVQQPTAATLPATGQATTPVEAGRLFVQALLADNADSTLALMALAARQDFGPVVARLPVVLSPCKNSMAEFTAEQTAFGVALVRATFTPPCGSYAGYRTALDPAYNGVVGGPIRQLALGVALVNDQWKVTSAGP